MKKFYRYMSSEEFGLMISGVTLERKNNIWKGANTTSDGFCFLSQDTKCVDKRGTEYTLDPIECYDFLAGIVSKDILVEFEVDESLLTESIGTYSDPLGSWGDRISITEYCCKSYSCKKFSPISVCVGYDTYKPEWINIHA